MNCTGKRCLAQYNKVDPATCTAVPYCPQATPPKTNADHIRAMTNEQLAEWLCRIADCNEYCCAYRSYCNEACKQAWLDWLKQEVSDEQNN